MQYTSEICDEVCHLYNDIEQERAYRVEKGEKLVEGVRCKLNEIRDAVNAEQRIRLESQSTLLELFGQMGQKMQTEMENSRKERHMGTERIIALMENVLPMLDKSRNFGTRLARDMLEEHFDARNMADSASENLKKRRQS